jgi:hypothetical protein
MRMFFSGALICAATWLTHAASVNQITIARTPEGGLQPQAAVDTSGTVHLIFFKGNPSAGDIFCVRRAPQTEEFSKPLRVNSEPQAAMAIGTIRGAQLAVAHGRVHVAWNGLAPKTGTYMDTPMLYTRLNDAATGFEPQRNLITSARGLDGGGSVAADESGNVFVFWHAPKPGNTNGEAGRALWVVRSNDEGKTFTPETLATSEPTGACGCCGMKAFADAEGNVFALFRSAKDATTRDELLLAGRGGGPLKPLLRDSWKIGMCPMSSASFATTRGASFAAWESRDNVFFTKISQGKVATPKAPEGHVKRKHPALAVNSKGELLLVWTEGTSWGKGGTVAWQLYDSGGNASGEPGRAENLPTWSMATAVAKADGAFLIIY